MLPATVYRLPDLLECAPKPSHSDHFSTYNFAKHQTPQPFDVLHAIPDDLRITRRRPYQAPSSFTPNGKENIPGRRMKLGIFDQFCSRYLLHICSSLRFVRHQTCQRQWQEVERPFLHVDQVPIFVYVTVKYELHLCIYMYTCT